jgi:hypothetical protein
MTGTASPSTVSEKYTSRANYSLMLTTLPPIPATLEVKVKVQRTRTRHMGIHLRKDTFSTLMPASRLNSGKSKRPEESE